MIQVETRDGRTSFHPGEEVEGTVRWQLVDRPPRSLEVRLFWYTEGKGGRDVGVVETLPVADPGPEGHQPFRFRLPDGPYSFSGKIMHLRWAIEAMTQPGNHSERLAERLDIVMSPSGREIVLATVPAKAGKR